jgi:hypothetical protein
MPLEVKRWHGESAKKFAFARKAKEFTVFGALFPSSDTMIVPQLVTMRAVYVVRSICSLGAAGNCSILVARGGAGRHPRAFGVAVGVLRAAAAPPPLLPELQAATSPIATTPTDP